MGHGRGMRNIGASQILARRAGGPRFAGEVDLRACHVKRIPGERRHHALRKAYKDGRLLNLNCRVLVGQEKVRYRAREIVRGICAAVFECAHVFNQRGISNLDSGITGHYQVRALTGSYWRLIVRRSIVSAA